MKNNQLPIGIFDSGVGGLTVARAVRDLLPGESISYLGDSARAPYGSRAISEVREFSLEMLDVLVARGVKMLVIACNTSSAAVLRDAYERYNVPIVEVILPTVRAALAITKTGRIGLLATRATVKSNIYRDFCEIDRGARIFAEPAPKFVELVEAGITAGSEVAHYAQKYCAPLLEADVDTVILGCTHYPFLRGALKRVVGDAVNLVSSDIETANEVYRVLSEAELLRAPGELGAVRATVLADVPGPAGVSSPASALSKLGETELPSALATAGAQPDPPVFECFTTGHNVADFKRLAQQMLGLQVTVTSI
ncbi:glutamate racemase [Canibacter sp. lx-45]|uniref:glutamate racemase n=1 Tax=Canibacter zhuwentaonis TaxID=2837491 RepID=UPI001BDD0BB7|nr:glutamate racemase [Canibacter zhuwentaonis]